MYNRHEFIKTVILCCVTCGIYALYLFYKVSEDVNDMARKEGLAEVSGFVKALLIGVVTCGIYYYYWIYKLFALEYDIAAKRGVSLTPDTPVLAFICQFVPILSYYIFCENFNKLADSYN